MEVELIDEIDFSVTDSPTPRKRAHDSSSSPSRENFTGLLGGMTSYPIKKMKQTNMISHPDSDEFSDEQNSFDDVPQNSQTVFVFEKIKRLSREELEQIVLQKMVEAITTVGPIKNLEQEICVEKKKIKIMERKIAELHQEVVSLTTIVRSFVSQPKNDKFRPPIKTTRSVGLQVTTLTMNDIKKFEPTSVNVDSHSTIIHIDDEDDRNGDDKDDDNDDDDIIEVPIENNLRVSSNIAQQLDSFFNQNLPSVPSLPCLPAQSEDDIQGPIPPSPILQVSKVAEKIVLSWKNEKHIRQEKISSYQVWIFNEGESRILNRWEPMKDDIKAISSTMACEIPMATVKPGLRSESRNRYHFAVRAVDLYSRFGHFSNVASTTFP